MNEKEKLDKFSCKICLDVANEPVLTPCGHLYCWICIYSWSKEKKGDLPCPFCNNKIDINKLTPIYTSEEDKRNSQSSDEIPKRPKTSYTHTNNERQGNNNQGNQRAGQNRVFFSFFGLPFGFNAFSMNYGGGNSGFSVISIISIVLFILPSIIDIFRDNYNYDYTMNPRPKQNANPAYNKSKTSKGKQDQIPSEYVYYTIAIALTFIASYLVRRFLKTTNQRSDQGQRFSSSNSY